jgi:hypothetical protein
VCTLTVGSGRRVGDRASRDVRAGARDDLMPGVHTELCAFVLAHRPCPGPRHANAGAPTVTGYRLLVVCGCGAEFKRWVILNDADEDLLKSALVAFEN